MFKLKKKLQESLSDSGIQNMIGIGAVVLLLLLSALASGLKLGPGEETGLGALLTNTLWTGGCVTLES